MLSLPVCNDSNTEGDISELHCACLLRTCRRVHNSTSRDYLKALQAMLDSEINAVLIFS